MLKIRQVSMPSPDLRILPFHKIIPHEGYDPCRVQRLVRNFQSTGTLFEPLIVTEYHGKFVLLDGATRSQALKDLSITEAVVQIVEYRNPEVRLRTWNHVVFDLPTCALLSTLEAIPGFSIEPLFNIPIAALDLDGAVAQIVSPSGERFGVTHSNPDLGIAWVLNQIVDIYRGSARVYRSTQLDQQLLRDNYPGFCTAIAFPRFHPNDVLQSATSGDHFPMGITRHIVAERVKDLNLPLNILRELSSIKQYSQVSQSRDVKKLTKYEIDLRNSRSIFP